ncbi:MAG: hypothetical protein JNM12_02350 [Alphaproteobacteria bacterium]|nr:hypothetical protein [Alphaproteobacteria bacterium]
MQNEDYLKEFNSILDAWEFGYIKIVCKYFVIKNGTQQHLLYGLIGFSSENLNPVEYYVETSQCIAGQEVFNFSNAYLKQLKLNLENSPQVFKTSRASYSLPIADQDKCRFYFDPTYFPNLNPTFRSPHLRILTDNQSIRLPDERRLELELRSHETPFDNIQDFFQTLGFPADLLRGGESAKKIHIIATTPIVDMTYKIQDHKTLNIKFWFNKKPQIDKFKTGIRIYKNLQNDPRFTFTGKEFSWSEDNGKITAEISKDLQAIDVVRIFPSYDTHNIGSVVVVDENFLSNNRHEAYSALFPNAPIQSFLSSANQDDFEFGISTLLHQLKLSPIHFTGIDKLNDGPDLLAYSNAGHIYIVECTIADPNNKGKLFKLHARTEILKEHYKKKGYTIELIRPVLFTSLPKANTVAHRGSAANFGISLICREDIEALVARITNPPTEQELFQAALNAIPEVEKVQDFKI